MTWWGIGTTVAALSVVVGLGVLAWELFPLFGGCDSDDIGWSTVGSAVAAIVFAVVMYFAFVV